MEVQLPSTWMTMAFSRMSHPNQSSSLLNKVPAPPADMPLKRLNPQDPRRMPLATKDRSLPISLNWTRRDQRLLALTLHILLTTNIKRNLKGRQLRARLRASSTNLKVATTPLMISRKTLWRVGRGQWYITTLLLRLRLRISHRGAAACMLPQQLPHNGRRHHLAQFLASPHRPRVIR